LETEVDVLETEVDVLETEVDVLETEVDVLETEVDLHTSENFYKYILKLSIFHTFQQLTGIGSSWQHLQFPSVHDGSST
jgi:hypothetical protein